MTEIEIIVQLSEFGITASSILQVGSAAFGLVVGAYLIGLKVGVAIALIRKI